MNVFSRAILVRTFSCLLNYTHIYIYRASSKVGGSPSIRGMFGGRYTGGGRDNSPRHHDRLGRQKDTRSVSPRPRHPSGEHGGGNGSGAGGAGESKGGDTAAAAAGAEGGKGGGVVLDLLAGGEAAGAGPAAVPTSPRGRQGSRGRADSQVRTTVAV